MPTVPRTLSGKKLELPVKRILAGESPDDVARATLYLIRSRSTQSQS